MRLIDADALLERYNNMSVRGRTEFDQEIMVTPSIDIEPKQGEWIKVDDQYQLATCSNCKKVTMFERWGHSVRGYDFCPNCGADMRKGVDKEQTMKCCGNCEYRRQSKLKIQFDEIPMTAYCDNKNSPYYNKYVWDDEVCDEWKGTEDEL